MFEDEPKQKNLRERPDPATMIAEVLNKTKESRPTMFAPSNLEAARYWIKLLEKQKYGTEKSVPIVVNEQVIGWRTPYHDRLIYQLRAFLGMSHNEQLFIIEMIASGVQWRGESINVCKNLVVLNEKREKLFSEGKKDQYITKVLSRLKNIKSRPLPYDKNSSVSGE